MKTLLLIVALCVALQGAVALTTRDFVNITQTKDEFIATYVHTTELNNYVIGVTVSTLNVQKIYHNNITLSHDEDWNDFCLDVVLSTPIPELLISLLPPKFLEVRIFYRVLPKEPATEDGPVCADGSKAINGACPAVEPELKPSGNISYDQIQKIQAAFAEEYLYKNRFVYAIGISTLATQRDIHHANITLNAGESWEDYCLTVTASMENSSLPSVYQGARVMYSFSEICPVSVGPVTGGECGYQISTSAATIFIALSAVFLFIIVGIATCRLIKRSRRCKQTQALQHVQQEQQPVIMPYIVPTEYDIEMYPAQFDPQEQHPAPVMVVPQGYPVFVPQHGWFMPVPQDQE
jgi:hypothetical protein